MQANSTINAYLVISYDGRFQINAVLAVGLSLVWYDGIGQFAIQA